MSGTLKLAQPRRDRIDREPRAPPRALRVALADLARQLGQRRVDLVLHQRRAGGGRAFGRAAPVDDRDPQSAVAQRVGHHRAGDAGADHQHVGLKIALERLVWDGRGAMLLPDRTPGPQILWFGDHRNALFKSGNQSTRT